MTRTNTSPLDYSGGFTLSSLQRIRLAYSNDIVQQLWKTETEIVTPVLFDTETGAEEWIVDWSKGDFDSAEFGIQQQVSVNGTTEDYSLKVIFETGITQLAFKAWFDKKLRKQQICVVATDSNYKERAFNPFEVTYKYISSGNESESSRYELTFTRTMLIEVFQDDHILGIIKICGENKASELKVNFISNKNSHYLIGLSTIDNPNGVDTWISGELSFNNVNDGDYYLFAKHKNEAFNILMSSKIKIDCYVCKLTFTKWEEFFECELSFNNWEEITEYEVTEADLVLGVNVGTIGLLKFSSKEHVFQSFENSSTQSVGKLYFSPLDTLKVGIKVYSDKTSNNILETDRWFGIKNYNNKDWAFKVNEIGLISEILENKKAKGIGFILGNHFGNYARAKMDATQAAEAGADSCYLTIEMGYVFRDKAAFDLNDATSWSDYDQLVNHINALFPSICLRICTDLDDNYQWGPNPIFNIFTDYAQDEWGNPARIANGSGHGSLAKASARQLMTDFVKKVLQRYSPILGSKLIGISVGNAAQQEAGYNYENQYYPNGPVPSSLKKAMFDYHPLARSEFANDFCKSLYSTLESAERAHNKNYNNWSDIVPPMTGKPSLLAATDEEIYNLQTTQLGIDWYRYRYFTLKRFWLECIAIIKAFAPYADFYLEAGSFTDELTRLRTLFDLVDMATYVDVFKAEFTSVNWNGTINISAAIMANNVGNKRIETEINENDVLHSGISDPNLVKEAMLNHYKFAKANGASKIWLIANSSSNYWENSLALIREFMSWDSANPNYKVTDGATVNIPISKFIKNYAGAHADCVASGLNTGITNRPIIKLIKDI